MLDGWPQTPTEDIPMIRQCAGSRYTEIEDRSPTIPRRVENLAIANSTIRLDLLEICARERIRPCDLGRVHISVIFVGKKHPHHLLITFRVDVD